MNIKPIMSRDRRKPRNLISTITENTYSWQFKPVSLTNTADTAVSKLETPAALVHRAIVYHNIPYAYVLQ